MTKIHPVVLSGGAGTRLWPMSRAQYPKQLLPLVSSQSLIVETVRRVMASDRFAPPTIVCNEAHRFVIAEQLRAEGVAPRAILLEPAARNTAPAIAAAACQIVDPNALLLVLPSDHVMRDHTAFMEAVDAAARAAKAGALVAFGVTPDRPETGYGYIRRGRPFDHAPGAFRLRGFVEKPDARRAKRYLAAGDYYWNAGMFLFKAGAYLDELRRLRPEMADACHRAVERGRMDLDFFRLDAESFAASPSDSIDYAVMEHTTRAAMVPLDAGWNDVGAWPALWEMGEKDGQGNVVLGPATLDAARGSYIRSEGPVIAAIGVEDLVIVATEDAVLVAGKGHAQNIKGAVEALRRQGRTEADSSPLVYRPWGSYRTIDTGAGFLVKRLTVKPRASLSLQRHAHRAEHWVVVSGTAEVTRGTETFRLQPNESTYIPLGTVHRLANPGDQPLHLIEVQSGALLSEDDIERLEDRYGRS